MTLRTWALSLGTVALFALPAAAEDPMMEGPYVRGAAGLFLPNEWSGDVNGAERTFDFGTGPALGLAAGWKWAEGLRAELEAGYRSASADEVNGVPGTGKVKLYPIMANLLYDFSTDGPIKPYIGAGAGIIPTNFNDVAPEAGIATYDESDTGFGAQAILGAAVPVAERLDLTLDYRYLYTSGLTIAEGLLNQDVESINVKAHTIMAGLRYQFGHSIRPEPVDTPAPPPPPAPPVAPEDAEYIVYFEFDRADLTTQAMAVIADAAKDAAENGVSSITLAGHADRAGGTSYNMALSEKRVSAVRAELQRLGIQSRSITTSSFGESRPAVDTPDGQREQLNRRVNIELNR